MGRDPITAGDFLKTAASMSGVVEGAKKGAKAAYNADINSTTAKSWLGRHWENVTGKNVRRTASKYGKIINDQAKQKRDQAKGLQRAEKVRKQKPTKKWIFGKGESKKDLEARADRIKRNAQKSVKISNKEVRDAQAKIDAAKRDRIKSGLVLGGGTAAIGTGAVMGGKAIKDSVSGQQ